jgi:hypothetical protein
VLSAGRVEPEAAVRAPLEGLAERLERGEAEDAAGRGGDLGPVRLRGAASRLVRISHMMRCRKRRSTSRTSTRA